MNKQPAGKRIAKWMTVCMFCAGCSLTAGAQLSVGIMGGYNRNYLQTNNANRDFTNYTPADGFSVGIPVQFKLADWFAIGLEPSYVQKNYQQERSSFYLGTYQISTNSYLQLPVMGHFMFGGKKLNGFFNLGAFGGYWAAGNVTGRMPNVLNPVNDITATNTYYFITSAYTYNEGYTFDTRRDNRIEAGWLAGAGINYALTDRYSLFAEGRMMQSVTDMQKNYMIHQVPRYNNTYGANLGLMIQFGNKETNNQ